MLEGLGRARKPGHLEAQGWLLLSGAISRIAVAITHIRGHRAPLILLAENSTFQLLGLLQGSRF